MGRWSEGFVVFLALTLLSVGFGMGIYRDKSKPILESLQANEDRLLRQLEGSRGLERRLEALLAEIAERAGDGLKEIK